MELTDVIKELDPNSNKTLDYIDEISVSVKSNESITGITQGIFAFLCLYRDNLHKLHEAREYAVNHFLHKKRGNALEVFETYIESCKTVSFEAFVQIYY
jgi:hypothetical protein